MMKISFKEKFVSSSRQSKSYIQYNIDVYQEKSTRDVQWHITVLLNVVSLQWKKVEFKHTFGDV